MPDDGLPSTLERSSAAAQRTRKEARDAAADERGEGGRARRTACAALEHSFEKGAAAGSPRRRGEVVPDVVELEVAVPRLRPAGR